MLSELLPPKSSQTPQLKAPQVNFDAAEMQLVYKVANGQKWLLLSF